VIRGLVAGLGLISVLAALIFAAFLMVNSLEDSFWGGSAGDTPSGGDADSLVLRISGTPGIQFSGNYTTPQGSQNFSGTLGTAPADHELGGEGIAGLNVVTANVQKQETTGTLKVEILKNGRVVQSAETNAANNAVSLTYSPQTGDLGAAGHNRIYADRSGPSRLQVVSQARL
jgi:hypothetical protein